MDAAGRVHRASFDERLPWLAGLHTPDEDRAFFRDQVFAACEVWGALDAGGLAGVIAFRDGWIDQLYVLPGFQDRGLGSALLEVATRPKRPLKLWTFQKNAGARRFYESKGFVEIERTDGAENEQREPDVLYEWRWSDTRLEEDKVLVSTEMSGGHTAIVRFGNPPLGTMTAAGAEAMLADVRRLKGRPDVRCLVITGSMPNIFIRHYDVAELVALGETLAGRDIPRPAGPPDSGVLALIDEIAALDVPVIAAINGHCMGGGFELALACDIRIAGRDVTQIGLPETRIGIFPGAGGTQRLPRIIGEASALEFILRGRVVAAAAAKDLGLVHEVAADPLERALEIAAEFAARPAAGLAHAKHLIRSALSAPLEAGLASERARFVEAVRLPGAVAAMRHSLDHAPLGAADPG